MLLEEHDFAHVFAHRVEQQLRFLHALDDLLDNTSVLELWLLDFELKAARQVSRRVDLPQFPHVRHLEPHMEVHVHGILRVHEIALIKHRHEVMTEGTVEFRVVYDELMVARLEKARKRVPILEFHIWTRQLRSVDNAHVSQLVAQTHVVHHVGPATIFVGDSELANDLEIVMLQKVVRAHLEVFDEIDVFEDLLTLADREHAVYAGTHHLQFSLEDILVRTSLN